jgi:FMN phosphatase YigB (HAD superfamily)
MKILPDVDFLIFDLGNVIIDIDYNHTFQLIKSKVPEAYFYKVDQFYQTDFHKDYEKGLIDSPTFRNEVRNYFEQSWTDSEVDQIWNSLLGKIPGYRIELIRKLKEKYQVGVLSNTNEIHIQGVNELLSSDFGMDSFEDLFDRVFYSHHMRLAKPSKEIYLQLISELTTSPEKILFFDDLKANVEGAKAVGIQAIHVTGPQVLVEFFNYV